MTDSAPPANAPALAMIGLGRMGANMARRLASHGANVHGAEDMWMAFLGPDTPPLGERTNCDRVTQSQIAATLAALLGEDYHGAIPTSGPVITQVLPPAK